MATDSPTANHPAKSDKTSLELQPERPDWEFWRQRGACRIWEAVLLSLNVEPTKANRDQLLSSGSQSGDEYERRREIVNVQYGVHPLLPTMEHARAGKVGSGRYISLLKLLEFAKEIGWRDTRDFENGLSRSTVHLPGGQIVEVEQEVDDLPKGERYMLVRMGALITIFERCLNSSQSINRQKFLAGDALNLSALGQELEEVIATAANEAKRSTVVRFSKEANRKQLAAAKKALKQFF